MKYETQHSMNSGTRAAWTFSVQAPRTLSLRWVLECISEMSVPIAAIGLVAIAGHLDLVTFR